MRVVIIISGLRGVFHASLEIARRLKASGVQVILGSSSDLNRWSVNHKFEVVKLPEARISKNFGPDYHTKYLDSLRSIRGDVFICDLECPVYIMSCMSIGKKVFILNHFLPIPYFADGPIPNISVIPGKGFRGTGIMILLGWVYGRSKFWGRAIYDRFKSGFNDRRSLLMRLGKTMGLDPRKYLLSRTLLPGPYLLFKGVPTLHIMAEEIDFKHRLASHEHYVGPMVYLDRKDKIEEKDQLLLNRIFNKVEKQSKRLVYCALSSNKRVDPQFIRTIVDVFQGQQDIEVIVGLGNISSKPTDILIPENIHFLEWVPGLKVLERAHCALIAAGYHTIHECIYFKVPMLAFSLGITDHNGFLARIESKKLGYIADLKTDNAEDIRGKVLELLVDAKVQDSLNEMKLTFDEYLRSKKLESLISEK